MPKLQPKSSRQMSARLQCLQCKHVLGLSFPTMSRRKIELPRKPIFGGNGGGPIASLACPLVKSIPWHLMTPDVHSQPAAGKLRPNPKQTENPLHRDPPTPGSCLAFLLLPVTLRPVSPPPDAASAPADSSFPTPETAAIPCIVADKMLMCQGYPAALPQGMPCH